MKKQRGEITFKDIMNIFLPKLWIVAAVAIVFALVVGVYSVFFKSHTYTSSVTIYVYKTAQSATSNDMDAAQDMMANYKYIFLESDNFFNRLLIELNKKYPELNISSSQLRSMIGFSEVTGTSYFKVSATSSNIDSSYKVASLISELAPNLLTSTIPNALEVTLIDDPIYPTAPNGKNVTRNVLIGFLIGVVLSIIIIWTVSIFDIVIHDKKKIEDNFDIPVLGVIPRQDSLIVEREAGAKNVV